MNFNIRFRRFIAKHFGVIVELVYKIKFKTIRFNKPPIIILTPGKVGSSSVYYTLQKETSNHVFHIHNFSKEGIKQSIKHHIDSNRKSRPLHLIISNILRKKLNNYKGKLLIITIIREPISREISSLFQNTELYKDVLENKKMEIDVKEANKILHEKFKSDICGNLKDWFDLEINHNFGIDVFANDFDHENKYVILQNKNTSLLLLKMEDLNEIFPKAIMSFLNLNEPLVIQNTNVGGTKHYASAYRDLKRNFRLDSKTINQIINSLFFQHFYSEDKFKAVKKWSKKD